MPTWFAYDGECGYDQHETREAAMADAEQRLEDCCEEAGDGWPEHTDSICWGRVYGAAEREVIGPAEEGGREFWSYSIAPVEGVGADLLAEAAVMLVAAGYPIIAAKVRTLAAELRAEEVRRVEGSVAADQAAGARS